MIDSRGTEAGGQTGIRELSTNNHNNTGWKMKKKKNGYF